MRVKLKVFQDDASEALLKNIAKMRMMYDQYGDLSATCLQAPTGSGKTVISADVIETLFFGSDERGIEGDEKACVLWISESPNLNAQTCNRFMTMSEKLADSIWDHRHVETIGNDFCASHEELDRHRVYFLSKDLLGKGKLLVKGSESNGGRVFWDVLNKTIEDPERHLYLFIDEAHRGLGENKSSEKGTPTIYANLIDGVDGRLPMPIVIGVSATPQRFEQAMMTRPDRDLVKSVEIKPVDVQESGLLKDIIELRIPEDDDQVEHQYIDMACERFDLARQRWAAYCEAEGIEPIVPLLVMQVRDGIGDDALKQLCEQICRKLKDLNPQVAFAHVFGDKRDRTPGGGYFIPYIEPELVADTRSVQVLFAKEAVSTGWDCPRAEVIFSQRRRTSPTYITQLIGRMVRTPLARRVDADETLNSVACYLSDFDPESAKDVVAYLTGEKDDIGSTYGPEPILNPILVEPVVPKTQRDYEKEVAEYERKITEAKAAWEAEQAEAADDPQQTLEIDDDKPGEEGGQLGIFDEPEDEKPKKPVAATPPAKPKKPEPTFLHIQKPKPPTKRDASFTAKDMVAIHAAWNSIVAERVPKGASKNPFTALIDTTTLMMDTGWDPEAGKDAREEFCKRLDAYMGIHEEEYNLARHKVEIAEMQIITIDMLHDKTFTVDHDAPVADDYGIALASKNAERVFGGTEFVTEYRKKCRFVEKVKIRETCLRLAAASISSSIIDEMQKWAKTRRDEYLEAHKMDYSYASEENRQEYDRLQNESGLTVVKGIAWPSGKEVAGSGSAGTYERYPKHILQAADGMCPLDLNNLEKHVLCTEMTHPNAVAFYRNPEHARTPSAFSVNYTAANGNRSACHPDFLFFMRDANGIVRPAIVDGHGAWIDDALAKLKGYVKYIQKFPDTFVQVVSVTDLKGSDEYRAIDLKDPATQDAIMSYSDDYVETLYLGEHSFHYGDKSEVDGLMEKMGVE